MEFIIILLLLILNGIFAMYEIALAQPELMQEILAALGVLGLLLLLLLLILRWVFLCHQDSCRKPCATVR